MSYLDGWSPELLKHRAESIRGRLADKNLQALAVTDPLNLTYVTGFFLDIAPWERPVVAVIPVDGSPFMILCELSTNHLRFSLEQGRGLITDIRFYTEHPRQVNRLYTVREWSTLVAETFREKDITKGNIAVDSNPQGLERRLKPQLPDLSFTDASMLLREMRVVKCEEELDLLRKAGALSDWGQIRYKESIELGKTGLEIGTKVAHLMACEAVKRYPNYQISISASGSPSIGMPHGLGGLSGEPIKKGDTIINGVTARLNMYGVENERTFIVGEPTEKQKKLFKVMLEAQLKAVGVCVEGNRVSDIDAVAQKVIEDAGYGDLVMHRTGHGMGLGGHEYWDDTAFNHRTLRAGMVTSVEPGIYVYGESGFRHSDTVIVGKDKPEVVTEYTKELEYLTVRI